MRPYNNATTIGESNGAKAKSTNSTANATAGVEKKKSTLSGDEKKEENPAWGDKKIKSLVSILPPSLVELDTVGKDDKDKDKDLGDNNDKEKEKKKGGASNSTDPTWE
jgi:hypothetical protein